MNNPIIENFANVQGLTYEEAEALINAKNDADILKNIEKWTKNKINSTLHPNRAQRRAWKRKNRNQPAAVSIADTATKLNYIDLISKLRKLNEQKERELNGATID